MPQAIGVGRRGERRPSASCSAGSGPPAWPRPRPALVAAERANDAEPSEATGIALAEAVGAWGEVGGYHEEARWDACCQRVLRQTFDEARDRPVAELSGGERKRLVLESLFASDVEILLLDEPDNFLDLSAKRWLEQQIATSPKTILFISHDRELLAAAADLVVTLEGVGAWMHPGGFATYDEARARPQRRPGRVAAPVGGRGATALPVLQAHEAAGVGQRRQRGAGQRRRVALGALRRRPGPRQPPPTERAVHMRLAGAGSGQRVLQVEGLEIAGLTEPFDVEVYAGDRVAVLGPERQRQVALPAAARRRRHRRDRRARWRLGARVHVGLFHQTDEVGVAARPHAAREPGRARPGARRRPWPRWPATASRTAPTATSRRCRAARRRACRCSGSSCAASTCCCSTSPPTTSTCSRPRRSRRALAGFEGTVLSVTHDRWFMRAFDRYLVFDHDCSVKEALDLDTALHLVTGDDAYPFRRSSVKDLTRPISR